MGRCRQSGGPIRLFDPSFAGKRVIWCQSASSHQVEELAFKEGLMFLDCVICKIPVEDVFHMVDNLPYCEQCFTDRLRSRNMTNVKKAERQLQLGFMTKEQAE